MPQTVPTGTGNANRITEEQQPGRQRNGSQDDRGRAASQPAAGESSPDDEGGSPSTANPGENKEASQPPSRHPHPPETRKSRERSTGGSRIRHIEKQKTPRLSPHRHQQPRQPRRRRQHQPRRTRRRRRSPTGKSTFAEEGTADIDATVPRHSEKTADTEHRGRGRWNTGEADLGLQSLAVRWGGADPVGGEPWEEAEDECKEKWGLREGERRRPQVPNGSEPVVQEKPRVQPKRGFRVQKEAARA